MQCNSSQGGALLEHCTIATWCCTRLLHFGEAQLQMHLKLVHTNKHQVSLLHSITRLTKYQLTEVLLCHFFSKWMYVMCGCVDFKFYVVTSSVSPNFNENLTSSYSLMSEQLALSDNNSMETSSNYIFSFAACISPLIKLTMWFDLYCFISIWMLGGDIHFSPSYHLQTNLAVIIGSIKASDHS